MKLPALSTQLLRSSKINARLQQAGLGATGFAVLLLSWEFASRQGWLNPIIVSSPTAIASAFQRQLMSGALLSDLAVSSVEFAAGFGLALVVGLALGFTMGLSRVLEYAIDPFIWFLYSSPLIALYPLIVVWFGFGTATVIAITFLLTFVSIVVNAMAGVHSVDEQLVRAIRAFGGSRRDIVFKLIVPATVSHILAGARIGLGRALHGVVLGEMFGANAGLGFSIAYYAAQLKTAEVFVPLTVLVLIGIVLNQLSALLESRLLGWRGH
jgi:NitT/TauT family transport system permease protein